MTVYSILFRLYQTSGMKYGGWRGGILLFVREDIPCKIIKTDCEGVFVEINLRKKTWLLCCCYNPHKSNKPNHLKNICKALEKLRGTYENLENFNIVPEEEIIAEFLNLYNLKNLASKFQINPYLLMSY